jgi:adenosylmethionine-8-amino-7-oxononanoate transaminase
MTGARTRRLRALDRAHVWHPFTPMADWMASDAVIVERGRGCYLYDTDGRRYFDGVSSLWVTLHGHRAPALDRAVRAQLGRIAHSTMLGLANVPATELAARLAALAPPGLAKVFYSDNGSTAVEVAIKLAFQYWRQRRPSRPERRLVVTFANAYHGDTLGAVSVGGIDLFHRLFAPLLFETIRLPSPYCYRCPRAPGRGCCDEPLDALRATLRARRRQVAAVILEPTVQAAAGMLTQPPGFVGEVQALCRAHDVLFIADEVATGFGRTGRLFACEHDGARPDLMALAKGITGGYLPLAATLTTGRIFHAFLGRPEEGRTFYHGHTYTGNPLACAAALANLDEFRRTRLLESLPARIEALAGALDALWDLPHVGDIRRIGMMVGIELVRDRRAKTPYPPAARMGHRVCMAAREDGIIIRPLGDTLVLMPPLAASHRQLAGLVEATGRAIRRVTEA